MAITATSCRASKSWKTRANEQVARNGPPLREPDGLGSAGRLPRIRGGGARAGMAGRAAAPPLERAGGAAASELLQRHRPRGARDRGDAGGRDAPRARQADP